MCLNRINLKEPKPKGKRRGSKMPNPPLGRLNLPLGCEEGSARLGLTQAKLAVPEPLVTSLPPPASPPLSYSRGRGAPNREPGMRGGTLQRCPRLPLHFKISSGAQTTGKPGRFLHPGRPGRLCSKGAAPEFAHRLLVKKELTSR